MVFKQIQSKHRLCDNIQYRHCLLRLRVFWGSAPIIDVMSATSHLLLDLYISLQKTKEFHWTPEAQQAFEQSKDCLTLSPSLAFPSTKEPFILYNHASQFAIRAVLSQVQDGLERVICYASKILSKAQSRYPTTKRELLAVVNYTKYFKHYLLG